MVTPTIDRLKVMVGSTVACMIGTASLVWYVSSFVREERDAQAERMLLLRSEMAEIGDSAAIQAVNMAALKDQMLLRMDYFQRDLNFLREDMKAQEASQAASMRELRADIGALPQGKKDGE
jgi:hypothetical protein